MELLRRVAYLQRAQRYVGLYSSINKKASDQELVDLTLLERAVEDKLKRLVEDPRTTKSIAREKSEKQKKSEQRLMAKYKTY